MRLRTRSQYQRIAQNSLKFTGRWILIDIRATPGPASRLGITVTKKFGHAPQRNRFKRLAREAFRLSNLEFPQTLDMIIRPRSNSLNATMQDIQNELRYFVEKAIHQLPSSRL